MTKQQILFASSPATLQILTKALESTADNVMITDLHGAILYVNPSFEKTTGYQFEEIKGQTPRILQSGLHKRKHYEDLWSTILQGKEFRATSINRKKNGDIYYADQTITQICNEAGEITHFVSVWKDVTERMLAKHKLEQMNKKLEFEKYKLEQILSFEEQIASVTRLNKVIDLVVEKACEILESRRCSLMLIDEHSKQLCIRGAQGLEDHVIRQTRVKIGEGVAGRVAKEGAPVMVKNIEDDAYAARLNRPEYETKSFMCFPIKVDHKILGVISVTEKKALYSNVYTDLDFKILSAMVHHAGIVIENAQIYKELRFLTITDPLTNIFNFRYFTKSLGFEISRLRRNPGPLCLLMVDVDDFKSYNHAFGQVQGDVLLKTIGQQLNDLLRETDIVCRYAGDEFAIILPGTPLEGAQVVAHKVMSSIRNSSFLQNVSLSIGIANYVPGLTQHDLIMKADQALYKAKKLGKNRHCAFQ